MAEPVHGRRGVLVATAIVAGVIAAVAWKLGPFGPEPEPEPDGGAVRAPAPPDAVILAADAHVERSLEGGWTPARPGDPLGVQDSIRAGEGATAEIALGRGTHITLAERSEVTVRELTAAAQRIGLVKGRISVHVQPDGTRVLRVEDRSGSVAAFGNAGRFGVLVTGGGLAIASAEGKVTVESGGRTVALTPGAETVAWRGAAPLPPRPVPREVVLRVARQLEERRASVCLVLHVDVAAQLTVDGEPVEVPPDGTVVVRLPPRERRRAVSVAVRHASGAEERRELPCWHAEGDVSDLRVRWNAR